MSLRLLAQQSYKRYIPYPSHQKRNGGIVTEIALAWEDTEAVLAHMSMSYAPKHHNGGRGLRYTPCYQTQSTQNIKQTSRVTRSLPGSKAFQTHMPQTVSSSLFFLLSSPVDSFPLASPSTPRPSTHPLYFSSLFALAPTPPPWERFGAISKQDF